MAEAGTWRVVLAQLPTTADAHAVVDAIGGPSKGSVPRVLRIGLSWAEANLLLDELHAVGAAAALLPNEMACSFHPAELEGGQCAVCSNAICAECRAYAKGAAVCPNCIDKAERLRRARRLRDLFAVFLFCVFLFEVVNYLRREAAALQPPVSVLIVELAPERLMQNPAVRAMNQPDDGSGRSLYDIGAFYQQEYTRYTGSTAPVMSVTIRGPFAQDVKPPVILERDPSWFTMALTAWRYPRYFHALARAHDIDPDSYGARIYVVWTDSQADVAGDSRGSQKGRVGVTWLSVQEGNPGYSVVAVAHELCHILGAVDNYDEGSFLAHWPEGFVEPFATPLWPQQWAELMAVDRPTGPQDEREVQSLFEARIGYDTAAHIGWIADEQAELYYRPRLDMPEQILHQLEAARAGSGHGQTLGAARELPATTEPGAGTGAEPAGGADPAPGGEPSGPAPNGTDPAAGEGAGPATGEGTEPATGVDAGTSGDPATGAGR